MSLASVCNWHYVHFLLKKIPLHLWQDKVTFIQFTGPLSSKIVQFLETRDSDVHQAWPQFCCLVLAVFENTFPNKNATETTKCTNICRQRPGSPGTIFAKPSQQWNLNGSCCFVRCVNELHSHNSGGKSQSLERVAACGCTFSSRKTTKILFCHHVRPDAKSNCSAFVNPRVSWTLQQHELLKKQSQTRSRTTPRCRN